MMIPFCVHNDGLSAEEEKAHKDKNGNGGSTKKKSRRLQQSALTDRQGGMDYGKDENGCKHEDDKEWQMEYDRGYWDGKHKPQLDPLCCMCGKDVTSHSDYHV